MLFVIMDSVSAFLGTPLDRSMSVTKASCYNLKNSAYDYSFIVALMTILILYVALEKIFKRWIPITTRIIKR